MQEAIASMPEEKAPISEGVPPAQVLRISRPKLRASTQALRTSDHEIQVMPWQANGSLCSILQGSGQLR